MRTTRRVAASVALVLTAGAVALVGAPPSGAGLVFEPNPAEYSCDGGTVDTYTVQPDVDELRIWIAGGEGGNGSAFIGSPTDAASGGLGGTVTANLAVTPGQVLTVEVGCAGGNATADPTTPVTGSGGDGAGDGGDGGASQNPGGGGGGSTQIADQESGDVLLVAGGGGGGGSDVNDSTRGGPGGGPNLPGCDGGAASLRPNCPGKGGTNSTPGAGGNGELSGPNGNPATGADGGNAPAGTGAGQAAGGGGGGYLGGGSGAGGVAIVPCGGGGGGAGFVDSSITSFGGESGDHEGDGYALIGSQTFTDVGFDHPFYEDIEWMAAQGISEGYEPGPTYRPSDPVTRQAMSAFLYRLAGEPEFVLPLSPTFTDVSAAHPFYDEIEWMADAEISTGYEPGPTYRPGAVVTRQAMSAFLYRFAEEPDFPLPPSPTFTDVSDSNAFYDEIEWMAYAEISEGYEPGPTYRPSAAVSRQAMSAFLHRIWLNVIP
jgi:hypothetical protein